jgi:hypothetical protein
MIPTAVSSMRGLLAGGSLIVWAGRPAELPKSELGTVGSEPSA